MFFRGLLLPLGAVLLSGLVGAPSSSGAQDALFVRTQGEIERLWSGVLGCADSGSSSFTIRNRFSGFESTYGGAVPSGGSSDYSQCGKRALRNTSSRILVDTIEEAVRSGGVSLFDQNFRLDSSVSWIWGENVTGDLDAVVPLLLADSKHRGSGHAFFVQPGLVFWTGLEEEERLDGNIGLVYRARFSAEFVAGGSVFYDYDFKNDSRRVGAGLDLQSHVLRAGLNYYHPLNEWQEGRTEYEEQPLQGGDFRLGFVLQRAWLDTSVGVWRFEGEDEEKTKWRPSFGLNAGVRIFPGVFLTGGYERQDGDDSFGTRWNTGLAFRFALPGLDGASSFNNPPVPVPNLFDPVEREKRILYEERLRIPQVNLIATVARIGEGMTATFTAELGEALAEDIALDVRVAETSTATLGTDFTYGHKVYELELDAETGEPAGQREPDAATDCPNTTCEVMIPAGVTRFDIEAEILMTAEREIAEFIDFLIEVPEEHVHLLRGSVVERVTIDGHDNEIAFASEAPTTLAENNETTGIDVPVNIDLPSPAPITLNVALSGTATEGEDYRISTRRLTIPANASNASLTLRGINNDRGEGSKEIILTLSGNLPEGWEITAAEHEVTLQDDDLAIFFTSATTSRVDEPGTGNADVTVAVGITQAPTADITVRVEAGGTGETATAGSSMDYTFAGMNFTFTPDDHADKTATFSVHPDNVAELDETIVLTLADMGTQAAREEDGFSLGSPHEVTIPANDNTVSFASDSATTLAEDNTTTGVAVRVEVVEPSPVPITLDVATGGTATEGTDYRISSRTLTIPANSRMSGPLTLRGINNEVGEGSKSIVLTLTGTLPAGWTLADAEHTLTLRDDDLSIFFTSATTSRLDEPGTGNADVTVAVGITQAPTADITVRVAAGGTGETATAGSSMDYTFAGMDFTFTPTAHADQTATFSIHSDTVAELDETIVLTLADMGTQAAREADGFSLGSPHEVIIPANDNTVSFASDSATTLAEDNTTTGVAVRVEVVEPSPVPITLNVATSGTATEGTDYSISSRTLTIPANTRMSGPLTLRGIDNTMSGGSKQIDLTLSGSLPNGWTLGTATHTVNLSDDDMSIFFRSTTPSEAAEPDSGNETVTVVVGITQAPSANITVRVTAGGTAEQGTGKDYTFAAEDITFTPTDHTDKSFTFDVHADNDPELDETIILTLADMGNKAEREADGFSLGANHTVTILANDNTVGFASATSTIIEGNGTTAEVAVNVNRPSPVPFTLNIAVAGTAQEGRNGDYTISSRSLTIGAEQSSGTITLTSRDEGVSEAPESIELTISADGSLPDGWMFSTVRHEATLIDPAQAGGTIGIGSPNEAMLEEVAAGTDPAFVDVPVMVSNSVALALALTNDITLAHTLSIPADENDDPGDDVVFTDVTLDAATGEGSARIEVSRDTFPEDEEVVTVTITAGETSLPSGWTIDENNNTYALTIPANDNTITFIEPFLSSIAESSGTTSITTRIDRQLPPDATATVTITPSSDSLVMGTDYSLSVSGGTLAGTTWTLPTETSEPTLTVTALSDIPANATLTLEFTGDTLPEGWSVAGDLSHEITITDSATPARPSVGFVEPASTVDEPTLESRPDGRRWAIVHNVQIRASQAAVATFVLRATHSGTATVVNDYTSTQAFEFNTGVSTYTYRFFIYSDNQLSGEMRDEPEEEETIIITLSDDFVDPMGRNVGLTENGNNFEISQAVHTVTIRANDNTVGFVNANSGAIEGETGEDVTIKINHPFPAGTTASVQVDIENNGTTAAGDYTITGDNYSNGILTLPSDSDTPNNTATLTVTAVDDAISSGDEGITLTLRERGNSFPPGWELGRTKHAVRFFDSTVGKTIGFATPGDDETFNPARIFEENPTNGLQNSLTVRVESVLAAPSGGFDLAWKVKTTDEADQLASADRNGGDIDFSEGDDYKEFEIMIENDTMPEGPTPVTLVLSAPTSLPEGWSLGVQEYTFTIESSDGGVSFADSTTDMTVDEGDTLTFEVETGSVTPSTGLTLSVIFNEGNDAAAEDLRFLEDIQIPAGVTSHAFTVEVIDDNISEGTEVYTITLGPGPNFAIGWGVAFGSRTITINPSDLPTIGFAQTASSAFEGDMHKIEFDVDDSYTVPEAGFSLENLGIAGALEDATYNSNALEDGLDVTVLPGANTGDKPHFIVSITKDGTATTPEAAETITFTFPDPLGEVFSAGTNTSHILTIESSNNIAFFDSEGATDHSGRVAENGTSVNAVISLFEFGAPTGGLPLKLQVTDVSKEQIEVNTNSPVSLSSDLDNPTNEVEFVVPAGMKTHNVPVYVRDNSTSGANDPAYFTLLPGDNFPDGWGEVRRLGNLYTLTIVDDEEGIIVSFSQMEGTASESSSGTPTATTNITIDPAPTEEVTIPVTFSGNAASYEIASNPSDALTRADGAATGTVTFAANQGSVELTLTAQDDDNAVSDTIKVGIDDSDSSFPDGYSSAGTWTVEVADKGPDTVGWFGYGIAFPDNVGSADMPPRIIELEELSVDITEEWDMETENQDVPVFIVFKDGDGNIYARDERNRPGSSPHDTKYQTNGSINPPLTFYIGVTGSAYGGADVHGADNDGDGQPDGEDGLFYLVNDNNALGGQAFSFSDASAASPVNGAIRVDGVARNFINDEVPEYAETLILTLEERAGGMLPEGWAFEEGRTVLTVNIAPSDNTVTFAEPSPDSIAEGESTTIIATINNPILAGKTANITITPGGTATRDTDYTLSVTGGTLSGSTWTLPTGVSTAALTVTALSDGTAESPDETIELAFAASTFPPDLPPGWTATEATHTITITD